MADINLSKAVRSNLLSLQNTADMMSKTQNRLATGNKVNSALDNPTNFFTAASLNSRASDMNNLLDNMSNGVKALEAADKGITSMTKTIESMQANIRQARQDKSWQSQSFTVDSTMTGDKNITLAGGNITGSVDIAISSVGQAGRKAIHTAQNAFTPGAAGAPSTATATGTWATGHNATAPSIEMGSAYTPLAVAGNGVASVASTTDYTPLDMTTGDETYTFTVAGTGSPLATITLDSTANTGGGTDLTQTEALAAINSQLAAQGSSVRVQDDPDNAGGIQFYETDASKIGTSNTISVSTVTPGGTSPSAAADAGWTTALNGAGQTATSYQFSVSRNGAAGVNVTLNTASDANNNGTVDQTEAMNSINSQLTTGGSSIRVRDSVDNPGQLEFYDSDATNMGSSSSINVSTTTASGHSPSAVANLGWTTNQSDTGTAARGLSIEVDGHAINVSSGRTLEEAIGDINAQLEAANINVKASAGTGLNAGRLVLGEKENTDGTNSAFSVTGADAAEFGGVVAGSARVDRAIEINNTAITIKGGDTLQDAINTINDTLGSSSNIIAINDGGKLSLTEKVAKGDAITIGGGGAAAIFGTAVTQTSIEHIEPGVRSVDKIVEMINSNTELEGKVRASNDNGKLRIENQSTNELRITGTSSGGTELNGSGSQAKVEGNTVRAKLVDEFTKLKDQLDKFAEDSSFNGINLLRGDNLKLTLNESGTSSLNIRTEAKTGVNSNTLNIEAPSVSEYGSDEDLDARLDQLSDALVSLRTQSSAFGTNLSIVENRQSFTKEMINTLETGAANLTLADMNEEAANLLALQTRQSLSSSALSMASQADQSVLQLLR